MTMQRWEPYNGSRNLDDTVNRVWRGFWGRPYHRHDAEVLRMPLDVVKEGDNLVVQATLPGIDPMDIRATVENDVLTIKSKTADESDSGAGEYLVRERRTDALQRSLRLPDTIDTSKADSRYENGVLTITFPISEAKRPKELEIKVA